MLLKLQHYLIILTGYCMVLVYWRLVNKFMNLLYIPGHVSGHTQIRIEFLVYFSVKLK
jgi:hypothetical protein